MKTYYKSYSVSIFNIYYFIIILQNSLLVKNPSPNGADPRIRYGAAITCLHIAGGSYYK